MPVTDPAPTANCSTCQTMAEPRIQAWPRSAPTTIAPSHAAARNASTVSAIADA